MKIFKYSFTFGLIGLLVSCNNYLDVNNNPNAPSISIPDPVLAGALVETARIQTQDLNSFAPYWSGYWAFSGTYSSAGNAVSNYRLLNSSGVVTTSWQTLFLNASNYTFVENAGKVKDYGFYLAIAKIMKAYNYHTLVDCYGNIPYTDSQKGFQNLNPTYDDAKSVYQKVISQLDTAVTVIKAAQQVSTTKVVPKTADVMFGGNMGMWIKLAYNFLIN